MFYGFKKIISLISNLIYNQKCLICDCAKTDDLLCKNCLKSVHYLSSFPQKIYNQIPIFCATLYKDTIKKLIQKLKFSHNKKCAIPLAKILFNYFEKLNLKDDFIIVYPPSFFTKNFQRGYNPMFLIVKEFSKLADLSYKKDLILKTKPTKPQYKAKNRHKNIKDSFKINEKYIELFKDKKILIIDDITTSGATLEELINCFLNVGIKNITCLTISKASV